MAFKAFTDRIASAGRTGRDSGDSGKRKRRGMEWASWLVIAVLVLLVFLEGCAHKEVDEYYAAFRAIDSLSTDYCAKISDLWSKERCLRSVEIASIWKNVLPLKEVQDGNYTWRPARLSRSRDCLDAEYYRFSGDEKVHNEPYSSRIVMIIFCGGEVFPFTSCYKNYPKYGMEGSGWSSIRCEKQVGNVAYPKHHLGISWEEGQNWPLLEKFLKQLSSGESAIQQEADDGKHDIK